ncbi:MFS transporter [Pseudomonas aeruginosa]|uniref:MFS transporter n=1 Tax=Pseudomonas aeruginosa TaxID=287 RepID=UPI0022386287|nr:MFS transporter [Pseudomonas aeruginosa]MCW5274045.1 MFS transporter [Pseudomonas aeruginosa]
MSNPYLELFAAPGAKGFSAAGLLARMPLSMTGLGIVTMLSQVHADYWLAGTVAATFVFCNALLAPQVSRLVDRFGQGRVLLPAALASALAMSALLLCTHYRAPNTWLYLFALLAGAMPSMPAMVRARWTELYRGSPKLHTAFSFESVMDEVCYIIGPVLAVSLIAGVSLFSLQRGTEPPLHAHPRRRAGSALAYPAVRVLALVLAAIGVIFGAVEVVSVAFAEAHGNKAAASLVLSVYAVGSCLAGLLFGLLRWRLALSRQLLCMVTLMALSLMPLLGVESILALALTVLVAGFSVAPTMILAMGLVERAVDPARLTEGLTWAITGLGIGMALGSALAGWVVEGYGAASGFLVAVGAGWLAWLLALACFRVLAQDEAGDCAVSG